MGVEDVIVCLQFNVQMCVSGVELKQEECRRRRRRKERKRKGEVEEEKRKEGWEGRRKAANRRIKKSAIVRGRVVVVCMLGRAGQATPSNSSISCSTHTNTKYRKHAWPEPAIAPPLFCYTRRSFSQQPLIALVPTYHNNTTMEVQEHADPSPVHDSQDWEWVEETEYIVLDFGGSNLGASDMEQLTSAGYSLVVSVQ